MMYTWSLLQAFTWNGGVPWRTEIAKLLLTWPHAHYLSASYFANEANDNISRLVHASPNTRGFPWKCSQNWRRGFSLFFYKFELFRETFLTYRFLCSVLSAIEYRYIAQMFTMYHNVCYFFQVSLYNRERHLVKQKYKNLFHFGHIFTFLQFLFICMPHEI